METRVECEFGIKVAYLHIFNKVINQAQSLENLRKENEYP